MSAPLAAVVSIALAGAWLSGTLLKDHAGNWQATGLGTGYMLRLCESPVFPSASCAGVVDGRWGSFDVYLGSRRVYVPTSLIGLVYFLALAIWFAMVGHLPANERWLWRLTLLVVSFGFAGSLFFTGLMAFVLSEWCPPCLIIHALNGAVLLCTVWLWRRARRIPQGDTPAYPRDPAYPRRYQRGRAGWAIAVAIGASVSVWLYFDSMTEVRRQWRKARDLAQVVWALQNDRSIVLHEYFEQPVAEIPQNTDGTENAEAVTRGPVHQIIVFTGHDCHGCKCFEPRRREMIEAAFSGQVRVDYRYLPAAPEDAPPITVEETNARARRVRDAWAATRAAEAARRQGPEAFTAMHTLLLDHRDEHPHPGCKELARRAGLDVERFEADLTSRDVRQQVEWNMDLAAGLGVSSLPAVFLNGRQVPDLCVTSQVFWSAIAEELAEGPSPETASSFVSTR